MMDEYISKETLQEKLNRKKAGPATKRYTEGWNDAILMVKSMIHGEKAANVAPVRHGRWLGIEEHMMMTYNTYFPMTATSETCSECNVRSAFLGKKSYVKDNRCPNCGAKMDGDADD